MTCALCLEYIFEKGASLILKFFLLSFPIFFILTVILLGRFVAFVGELKFILQTFKPIVAKKENYLRSKK